MLLETIYRKKDWLETRSLLFAFDCAKPLKVFSKIDQNKGETRRVFLCSIVSFSYPTHDSKCFLSLKGKCLSQGNKANRHWFTRVKQTQIGFTLEKTRAPGKEHP